MADEKNFQVERVTDHTYINDAGEPVEGKRVRYRILELNEVHHTNVPSLDPQVVQEQVEQEVISRLALTELG